MSNAPPLAHAPCTAEISAGSVPASGTHAGEIPVGGRGLEHGLLPTMAEWEVVPDIAVATAVETQRQGLARLDTTPEELADYARHVILDARRVTELLFESGIIPPPPDPAARRNRLPLRVARG